MNTDSPIEGSARIYQFPRGGRAALGGQRYGETQSSTPVSQAVQPSIYSGSWYHDEAIQEARSKSQPSWDH
ncbi:DUF2735 domain-containing protein [Bradyrhizobium sp. HKCCYLS1011]|uniref:DUF2735 domain-containing protein n=1 Tax=Bradyrhizobium sp. HKCCYLS1011 TaxID=3420733 RepID=UPI003EC0701E